MKGRVLSWIVLGLAVSATADASVNLLANGTFATDLANWQAGDGQAAWSAESVIADGTGSARITCDNAIAGTACSPLLQCVLVSPGAHLLRAAIRVPVGQPTTGHGSVVAYAYPNSICGGAPVAGAFFTPSIASTSWTSGWARVDVPAGAASVSIRLTVVKVEAGGEFDVLADAVALATGLLFVDGFGSGNASAWSSTVP